MSIQKRWFLCAAALFAGLCPALALTGTPPVLANAVGSRDQFQFTLRGQTNVIYVIETSSDLRTWTPALTNSDPHATRTITAPAVSSAAFWRIRRAPEPLFSHAIAARGTINMDAGSGLIDSFDSADANYCTAGQYDPAKRKPGGHIASGSGFYGTVGIGNMEVAGVVSIERGGTVTVGPSGSVGSFEWLSGNRGIEPGYLRHDMNLAFAPATLPTNFSPVPEFVAQNVLYPPVGGTNYKYAILSDGDYRIPYISIRSGEKMLINARARLLVHGSTAVHGTNNPILLGPNASIEWYAAGPVELRGSGGINASGLAHNFSIIGLSNAPVSYGGHTPLVATIHAPLSTVTLLGATDVIGAVVCNNLTLGGAMSIHFDENLARVGPWR